MHHRPSHSPTDFQQFVSDSDANPSIYLTGPAGSGKTTAAVSRMQNLLESDPWGEIMVLTPHRALGRPYLSEGTAASRNRVHTLTMNGLARRMVNLFWPLLSEPAGFRAPYEEPRFLTMETAQVVMGQIVEPLLDQGFFSTITLTKNRLYSQLIDNLNKSAIVGFPHSEIGQRLKSAWIGDASQLRVYDEVQECVNLFRARCLEDNFLDLSLQVELFTNELWQHPICRRYLRNQYQHLIYDNVEEDPPYAHDLVEDWLPDFKSALLISDSGGGFRRFLGADPISASRFAQSGLVSISISTESPEDDKAQTFLHWLEGKQISQTQPTFSMPGNALQQDPVIPQEPLRHFPQMIDQAVDWVAKLWEGEDKPSIVLLAPFISTALSFELESRLSENEIPLQVVRTTVPLITDWRIRLLADLLALIEPDRFPLFTTQDLSRVLTLAIAGLDPVRSFLLSSHVIKQVQAGELPDLTELPQETAERVGVVSLTRLGTLLQNLQALASLPLDLKISRLFSETLAAEGFGFWQDDEAGAAVSKLMRSYRNYTATFNPADPETTEVTYLSALREGLISDLYTADQPDFNKGSVVLSPVMNFLMLNQAVDHQIWLNVNSAGWYQRLEQPLTQPYVLSRNWMPGEKWDSEKEKQLQTENIDSLSLALLRRCRGNVFIAWSQYNDAGIEERGRLLKMINSFLKQTRGQS